jgi:hypothetical protein
LAGELKQALVSTSMATTKQWVGLASSGMPLLLVLSADVTSVACAVCVKLLVATS